MATEGPPKKIPEGDFSPPLSLEEVGERLRKAAEGVSETPKRKRDEWDTAILGEEEIASASELPLSEARRKEEHFETAAEDGGEKLETFFRNLELLDEVHFGGESHEPMPREEEGAWTASRGRETKGDAMEEAIAQIGAAPLQETAPTLFGITSEELSRVEGFDSLSSGQKRLVFENLKQITLARIKEESAGQYKKAIADEAAGAGLWRRVWQGMRESFLKPYSALKLEKTIAEELKGGGMAVHGDVLKDLVRSAQNGPEVLVKEDGELEFIYLSAKVAEVSHEDKEKTDAFNSAATILAKVPDEWKYETASGRQRRSYEKAKKKYDTARGDVLSTLSLSHENLGENEAAAHKKAMLFVNEVDGMVAMNQFFTAHPNVEKELTNIENRSVWKRAVFSTATEKLGYGLFGFGARWAGTAALGLIGAPLAAAGMGGFLARKRARRTLRESEISARRGEKDARATAKNMVSAHALKEKLERLVNQIKEVDEEEPNEAKKQKLASLGARIEYTERKLQEGRVDFGYGTGRIEKQYGLLSALAHARMTTESGTSGLRREVSLRLEKFLGFKERNIREAEKRYLNREMMRGMAVAAGFAMAGYLIRDFFSAEQVSVREAERVIAGAKEAATEEKLAGFGAALYQGKDAVEQFFAESAEEIKRWFDGWFAEEIGTPEEEAVAKIAAIDEAALMPEEMPRAFEPPVSFDAEAPEVAPVFLINLDYQGGRSIWEESGKQLEKRFSEFAALGGDKETSEALKTFNIDRVKDTIVNNPMRYGIHAGANVDTLSAEQMKSIKWDDAFADTFREGGLTANLPQEKIAKIIENNQTLREFFRAHPHAPRTSANYEAILRGSDASTGESAAPSPPPVVPAEEIPHHPLGSTFESSGEQTSATAGEPEESLSVTERKPYRPFGGIFQPGEEAILSRGGEPLQASAPEDSGTPELRNASEYVPQHDVGLRANISETNALEGLIDKDIKELQAYGLTSADTAHVDGLLSGYETRLYKTTAGLKAVPWEDMKTRELAKETGEMITKQLNAAKTAQDIAGSSFLLSDRALGGEPPQDFFLSRGRKYEEAARRMFESAVEQSKELVSDKTITPEAKVPALDSMVESAQRRLFSLELAKHIQEQGQKSPHLDGFVAQELPRAEALWEQTFDAVSENNRDMKVKYPALEELSRKQEELIIKRESLLERLARTSGLEGGLEQSRIQPEIATLNEEITNISTEYGKEYGKILNPDGVTLNEAARKTFLEMRAAERSVIDNISKVLYDKKIMHEVKILDALVNESRPAVSGARGGQGVPLEAGWKAVEDTKTGQEILKAYKTISRWEQDEFVRLLEKHVKDFRSARSWFGNALTSYDDTTERLIKALDKIKGKPANL